MRLQAYLNYHAGVAAPTRWGSPRTMIPWEVPDSPRVLASVRRHNGTPILPVQSGEGTPERINPGVQIDPGFRAHELLAFDTRPAMKTRVWFLRRLRLEDPHVSWTPSRASTSADREGPGLVAGRWKESSVEISDLGRWWARLLLSWRGTPDWDFWDASVGLALLLVSTRCVCVYGMERHPWPWNDSASSSGDIVLGFISFLYEYELIRASDDFRPLCFN